MLVPPEHVRRAANRDREAFEEIVRAYRPRVLGTLARLVPPEQADGVAANVFLRVHASLPEIVEHPQTFEPLLYRLTVNSAYDRRRNSRRADGS